MILESGNATGNFAQMPAGAVRLRATTLLPRVIPGIAPYYFRDKIVPNSTGTSAYGVVNVFGYPAAGCPAITTTRISARLKRVGNTVHA